MRERRAAVLVFAVWRNPTVANASRSPRDSSESSTRAAGNSSVLDGWRAYDAYAAWMISQEGCPTLFAGNFVRRACRCASPRKREGLMRDTEGLAGLDSRRRRMVDSRLQSPRKGSHP